MAPTRRPARANPMVALIRETTDRLATRKQPGRRTGPAATPKPTGAPRPMRTDKRAQVYGLTFHDLTGNPRGATPRQVKQWARMAVREDVRAAVADAGR